MEHESKSSEWPGTKLLGGTALIRYYKWTEDCANIISNAVNGLYDLKQPDFPEDLCLIRGEGDPFLVTISHEKDAYLVLTPEEKEDIIKTISALKGLISEIGSQ